jgi:hypothetical protein
LSVDWNSAKYRRTIEEIRKLGSQAPATVSGSKTYARTQSQGVLRLASVIDSLILLDMDHVIMDLLHLYFRTTERMLNDLFDCYSEDSRKNLVIRLKDVSTDASNKQLLTDCLCRTA